MDKRKDSKIKDIERNPDKVTIFKNDSDFYYLYKKTEKIASAVYLITNFFSVHEPLKWTLRDTILELLKDTLELANITVSDKEPVIRKMSASVFRIISLFEIGFKASLISEMNFTIIKNELYTLVLTVEEKENSPMIQEDVLLTEEFFQVEQSEKIVNISNKGVTKIPQKTPMNNVLYKGHSKGHDVLKNISDMHASYLAQSNAGGSIPQESVQEVTTKDKSNDRQEVIYNYLTEHKVATIKDIASIITDCSEKTIQRELGTMLDQGRIKKMGERRWSKYFIA
jgi:hypothetical protein